LNYRLALQGNGEKGQMSDSGYLRDHLRALA
jgi:hypothetical protein